MLEHFTYPSIIPYHLCTYLTMDQGCHLRLVSLTFASVEEKSLTLKNSYAHFVRNVPVLECAAKQELVKMALESLKPVVCPLCSERFADKQSCDTHYKVIHTKGIQSSQHFHAKELSVAELKQELRKRELSTTANKSVLSRRLEGCLACEK